jgi:hypothetical protein
MLAIAISLTMLAGANLQQFLGGTAALAIGAALYLGNNGLARRRQSANVEAKPSAVK